jgi:hypothetical protein
MGKINPLILEIGIPVFVLGCAGIYYKYFYNTGSKTDNNTKPIIDDDENNNVPLRVGGKRRSIKIKNTKIKNTKRLNKTNKYLK